MKLNFILPEESTNLVSGWHTRARARARAHTHTHTHKRGVNPTGQPPRGTPWVMLMPAVL